MVSVVMYTKNICPYCVRAKGLLKSKGVEVFEISIEGNDSLKLEMVEKSNGAMTVPQIFIDEFHVGGCDDLFDLDAKGELDPLLF